MTPDQLHRESIRAFSIDSTWVSLLIDRALSLGNHHSQDGEDVICKYIKNAINNYLTQPRAEDQILKQPGDPGFLHLHISLPIHRQMYQLGDELASTELKGDFKLPPESPDPSMYGKDVTCTWKKTEQDVPYDWETRMVHPARYTQHICSAFQLFSGRIDSTTLYSQVIRPYT
ncbi:hypothetical protein B0T10DRAFT_463024 [Thelonectria olida]|uniref:Uncharacterized protein n=1 Tax=Thelonectria olida TaxID=1576542 RepID=A0A9P9AM10_9HYPO|nr:hypothetical protein B0T10DRAFT_463024 [Thelonectria olida]